MGYNCSKLKSPFCNSFVYLCERQSVMLLMRIYRAIRKLLPRKRSRQSGQHSANSEGLPRWDVWVCPLLWRYSIHYDMLLWPELRSTLSRCKAEQSNRTTQVLIEALPDRSTSDVAGYRELYFQGKPVCREALKAQASSDGTISLVPYSPRLTV